MAKKNKALDAKFRQKILSKYVNRGWACCAECGTSKQIVEWDGWIYCELDVHHKEPKGSHSELRHVRDNATLLCRECHGGHK
jgi:5-methylcytosine-specific restriction endonuclease McrA